jgi:hypothetical protein
MKIYNIDHKKRLKKKSNKIFSYIYNLFINEPEQVKDSDQLYEQTEPE